MSSYSRSSNGKCLVNKREPYKQYWGGYSKQKGCELRDGRVIPSCSNVLGVDGWPASTPNQSNAPYINGVYRTRCPNGSKPYSVLKYLIDTKLYNAFHVFRINTNNYIYAKDVKVGDKIESRFYPLNTAITTSSVTKKQIIQQYNVGMGTCYNNCSN